jgi:protein-S-isoprenylcysteine O-methyltransferase Ste14
MRRFGLLLFGVLAYAAFVASVTYLVAWLGNLQATPLATAIPGLTSLVPRSIDSGGRPSPAGLAAGIDLALILLFGAQHSVMARTGFKAWLKRHLPAAAERSTYVLCASAMLALMFWQWRPLTGVVWSLGSGLAQAIGWIVFAGGFALSLVATFLIDHFDLFGLRQVWHACDGDEEEGPRFATPLFYRFVRHPLYLGFLLAFWGGPVMSVGHLLFAATMTAYILVAIQFEERDLLRQLGEGYAAYRARVPMLLPKLAARTR